MEEKIGEAYDAVMGAEHVLAKREQLDPETQCCVAALRYAAVLLEQLLEECEGSMQQGE